METFTVTTDLDRIDTYRGVEVTWGKVADAEGEIIAEVALPATEDRAEWDRLAAEAITAEGFTLTTRWAGSGEIEATVTR